MREFRFVFFFVVWPLCKWCFRIYCVSPEFLIRKNLWKKKNWFFPSQFLFHIFKYHKALNLHVHFIIEFYIFIKFFKNNFQIQNFHKINFYVFRWFLNMRKHFYQSHNMIIKYFCWYLYLISIKMIEYVKKLFLSNFFAFDFYVTLASWN